MAFEPIDKPKGGNNGVWATNVDLLVSKSTLSFSMVFIRDKLGLDPNLPIFANIYIDTDLGEVGVSVGHDAYRGAYIVRMANHYHSAKAMKVKNPQRMWVSSGNLVGRLKPYVPLGAYDLEPTAQKGIFRLKNRPTVIQGAR